MPDPVWYYARGEVEKGPLSSAQIKALASAGKIRPDDYVWKEGMENWLPAAEIRELFSADPAQPKEKEKATAKPSEKGAEAGKTEKFRRVPERVAAKVASSTVDPKQLFRWGSRIALLVGILAVVTARGCDAIGMRYSARLAAMSSSAEQRFKADWDERLQAVEAERREHQELETRSPADEKRLRDLGAKLADLQQQMKSEESRLRATRWSQLETNAKLAVENNAMWGYWRELLFQFGSIVLTFGLVGVAYTNDGPERWICLVILAVVVYSIFQGAVVAPMP